MQRSTSAIFNTPLSDPNQPSTSQNSNPTARGMLKLLNQQSFPPSHIISPITTPTTSPDNSGHGSNLVPQNQTVSAENLSYGLGLFQPNQTVDTDDNREILALKDFINFTISEQFPSISKNKLFEHLSDLQEIYKSEVVDFAEKIYAKALSNPKEFLEKAKLSAVGLGSPVMRDFMVNNKPDWLALNINQMNTTKQAFEDNPIRMKNIATDHVQNWCKLDFFQMDYMSRIFSSTDKKDAPLKDFITEHSSEIYKMIPYYGDHNSDYKRQQFHQTVRALKSGSNSLIRLLNTNPALWVQSDDKKMHEIIEIFETDNKKLKTMITHNPQNWFDFNAEQMKNIKDNFSKSILNNSENLNQLSPTQKHELLNVVATGNQDYITLVNKNLRIWQGLTEKQKNITKEALAPNDEFIKAYIERNKVKWLTLSDGQKINTQNVLVSGHELLKKFITTHTQDWLKLSAEQMDITAKALQSKSPNIVLGPGHYTETHRYPNTPTIKAVETWCSKDVPEMIRCASGYDVTISLS